MSNSLSTDFITASASSAVYSKAMRSQYAERTTLIAVNM